MHRGCKTEPAASVTRQEHACARPAGTQQQQRRRDCSVGITNTEAELLAAGHYEVADDDHVEINRIQVLRFAR